MTRALFAALLILSLALVRPATEAGAHAAFITATPAPDSTVDSAPWEVRIIFSQTVMRASTISVTGPDGTPISGDTVVEDNVAHADIFPWGPGVYTVQWSNVSAEDGHASSGQFTFTSLS